MSYCIDFSFFSLFSEAWRIFSFLVLVKVTPYIPFLLSSLQVI